MSPNHHTLLSAHAFGVKQISRRHFLTGCAACTACASFLPLGEVRAHPSTGSSQWPKERAKVRLVFTHAPSEQATWPHMGYDYEGRKKELTAKLVQACPNIQFLPATVQSAADVKKLLETDQGIDGYVVYMVGLLFGVPREIAAAGRPTIFVDDLYAGSGEFLMAYAEAKRKGLKVAGVASSRFEDVVQAVKSFECLKKMRASTVLDITERDKLWGDPQAIRDVWGTQVQRVSAQTLNQAYQKVDRAQAAAWAKTWISQAEEVVEPGREAIENSAAIYLAMDYLLQKNQAQALTIDCLMLLHHGGRLPAHPCLGLFQFNNDGLVGGCESDLLSTLTMLLMNYLSGRPGFVSDPVIDTAKNQIIYAHCVCTNKVFGPAGPANPYHIRSHSEDRKGAAVRSLLPLGEITTTIQFNPTRKEVIMHQGISVANINEDKACRTKLAVEVKGDINKLMTEWDRWGWHRVTFFGDLKPAVETISALMGFRVIMEA